MQLCITIDPEQTVRNTQDCPDMGKSMLYGLRANISSSIWIVQCIDQCDTNINWSYISIRLQPHKLRVAYKTSFSWQFSTCVVIRMSLMWAAMLQNGALIWSVFRLELTETSSSSWNLSTSAGDVITNKAPTRADAICSTGRTRVYPSSLAFFHGAEVCEQYS